MVFSCFADSFFELVDLSADELSPCQLLLAYGGLLGHLFDDIELYFFDGFIGEADSSAVSFEVLGCDLVLVEHSEDDVVTDDRFEDLCDIEVEAEASVVWLM